MLKVKGKFEEGVIRYYLPNPVTGGPDASIVDVNDTLVES